MDWLEIVNSVVGLLQALVAWLGELWPEEVPTNVAISLPAVSAGVASAARGPMGWLFNARQAKKAHQRSVSAYQNRYSWAMQDLRRSGLNPILAAQGLGGGSAPSAPAASGGSMDNPAIEALDADLKHANKKVADSTNKHIEKQAQLTESQKRLVDTRIQGEVFNNARSAMDTSIKKLEADFRASKAGRNYMKRRISVEGLPHGASQMSWLSEVMSDALSDGLSHARGSFKPGPKFEKD